jgi:tetratricopeptide (TPR) repeat protein
VIQSFITKWLAATRPIPDPTPASPKELAHRRKQRRLITGTLALILAVAAGAFGYNFFSNGPARARAEMERGLKKMGPGSYDQAIRSFDRAIDIWPDFAEAYLNRAVSEHILGQLPAALADLEKALEIDPNLARAYNERGQMYLEKANPEKAIQEFDRSIQVQPTLDGYYQRGQAHEILGDHQKAIADYDSAIREFPDAPYIYRARATAKRNQGDSEAATADLETADRLTAALAP